MTDDYSWMTDTTFEIANPYRARQRRFRRAFWLAAILIIISCGLAGLSH